MYSPVKHRSVLLSHPQAPLQFLTHVNRRQGSGVGDDVGDAGDNVGDNVGDTVGDTVGDNVGDDVGDVGYDVGLAVVGIRVGPHVPGEHWHSVVPAT